MMQVIKFNSGPPSNFHIAPFWLPVPIAIDFGQREMEFKGTEWWFQAYKAGFAFDGTREMYEEIVEAETAREAKRLGRLVPLDEDELRMWNGFQAVQAMLEGCLAKFWQNEECQRWLLNTGDAHLVEHRSDPVWGDNMDGSGRNLLGLVLELVRAQIK
jgi:ribA/ribD-fused uncharacterized protein